MKGNLEELEVKVWELGKLLPALECEVAKIRQELANLIEMVDKLVKKDVKKK